MNFHDRQTLLDYHYWARDRILEAVESLTPEQYTRDLGNSFKSVRDTIVHTYSADRILQRTRVNTTNVWTCIAGQEPKAQSLEPTK